MYNCLNCNKEFIPGRNTHGVYCSNKCQGELTSQKVVDTYLANPSAETLYNAGIS